MDEFKGRALCKLRRRGGPWVARLVLGLQELVYAVPAFGTTRDAFVHKLADVFDSLKTAFEELRSLRKRAGGEERRRSCASCYSRANSSAGRSPVAAAKTTIGPYTGPSFSATASISAHDSNGRFS